MYDTGKVFIAGGAQDYTNSAAFTCAHCIRITRPFAPFSVEQVLYMRYPRGFVNAVVLPDSKVHITGGRKRYLVFINTDSSLPEDVFDPATKTFCTLAEEQRARHFHSVSVLLADGRVVHDSDVLCYIGRARGGNEAHCDHLIDHRNRQVFSPSYLFNTDGSSAMHPVISSVSVTNACLGASIVVRMGNSNSDTRMSFSLVRMGNATLSINSDQRPVALTDYAQAGSGVTARLPSDSGILLSGCCRFVRDDIGEDSE